MNTTLEKVSVDQPRLVPAIFVGGFIAGLLDLTCAYISYGVHMPRGIARGLVGSIAFQGGVGYYILGSFCISSSPSRRPWCITEPA